jgi:hypothetical protein
MPHKFNHTRRHKFEKAKFKGLWWLLYRHSSTRTRRDRRTLNALERGNRRIYRAWRLKDEFEQLWEYKVIFPRKCGHRVMRPEALPVRG